MKGEEGGGGLNREGGGGLLTFFPWKGGGGLIRGTGLIWGGGSLIEDSR